MNMTMGSNGAIGVMPVSRLLDFDRDETDLAVLDAVFSDCALREGLCRSACSGSLSCLFQHRDAHKISAQ
jgi:hypothetical protein